MLADLKENRVRIFRAALVSVIGLASTYAWYVSGEGRSKIEGRRKVAVLVKALNEVQRRPEKRLIWEGVSENEDLYAGEAIRTTDISEASIRFDSGTQIELEPDSLVILEENAGNLALNFLKGNMFVSQTGTGGAEDVQINSGNKQLKIGDLKKSGGVISANTASTVAPLKVLGPAPHKSLYINPVAGEKISFDFEKLEAGYDVQLEIGTTPKKLKPYAGAVAKGDTGSIKTPMKIGSFYWRLVARVADGSKPEKASVVQKNEAIAKVAPSLIKPLKDEVVMWDGEEPTTTFNWSNISHLQNMVFELSRTKDFKTPLVSQNAGDETEFETEIKDSGSYFWRVHGQMAGTKEQLMSEVQSFAFKREFQLVPPKLQKPAANEHLSHQLFATAKLPLRWDEVPGVDHYKLSLKAAPGGRTPSKISDISEETKITEFHVANLEPGAYVWTVAAVDKNGKESAPSPERKFFLDMLPKLQWADGQDAPINYAYTTEKPSLQVEWQKNPVDAKKWKVRVALDGESSSEAAWSEETNQAKWRQDVPKVGKYQVEIEAFNDKDEIVAKSQKRIVNVQELPLLPAPEFAEAMPKEMMAKNNGSLQVLWKPVTKASRYVVELKGADGATVKETVFDRTSGSFSSLLPGQYKVVLKSVDQNGRRGPASEARPLLVPDRSDARAPKIKAIKVK